MLRRRNGSKPFAVGLICLYSIYVLALIAVSAKDLSSLHLFGILGVQLALFSAMVLSVSIR